MENQLLCIWKNEVNAGKCKQLNNFKSLLGLYPAWGRELEWEAERVFISELIASQDTLNVPILVCEDDLDLGCIVILARIRKENTLVYWDKIGLLRHENEDINIEKKSGILLTEVYTNDDWKKYGDNIALSKAGSKEWCDWISNNWCEELSRRRRYYTKPYMQKDENIIWIENVGWCFNEEDYQACVDWYSK